MVFGCCCFSFSGGKENQRTVNLFCGFFFVINYVLGTGYLGVPYAFFYSGHVAAIPTIIVIAVISWINANYVLEVMARAQVSQVIKGCECVC